MKNKRLSRATLVAMFAAASSALAFTACATPRTEYALSASPGHAPSLSYNAGAHVPPAAQTSSAPSSPVVLPIEVFGADGTVKEAAVDVPSDVAPQVRKLWLLIHGIGYSDKISVQVNGGGWIPLDNATATVLGPAPKFGGIGGAFSTLKMTIPVASSGGGAVVAGKNTVRFRFNRTDGVSMGFRVLGFDFMKADGTKLLPPTTFVKDDPAGWKPPYSDAKSISEGERLWKNADLIKSPIDKAGIKARCADCHAHDGRDLKYFNYSNLSIVERSKFHGLTEEQGKLIASYVRTIPTVAPGRPWDPPYQPGPGIDAKPVSHWAAGAGLDWVLDSDEETFKYLFPKGFDKTAVATTGHLNVREIPVSMLLPDWNQWLPRIHPKDAWGQEWASTEMFPRYEALRASLSDKSHVAAFLASPKSREQINLWGASRYEFLKPKIEKGVTVWTPALAEKVYGTGLWQLVKTWEIMHEFDLEGHGADFYGSQAESRTWFDRVTFAVSPFMLKIPNNENGIGGSAITNEYLSNAWYHLQLVLNPGNKKGFGTTPIDWGYVWGKFKDLYRLTGYGEMARYTVYFVKGMQEYDNENGLNMAKGWNPNKFTIDWMVRPTPAKQWSNYSSRERSAVFTALIGAWLDKSMQYPAEAYYEQKMASPDFVPSKPNGVGQFGDRLRFMIPAFKAQGVDRSLLQRVSQWAKTIFPQGDWEAAMAG